nr:MAG TPA: hypothetical protein [Caudoviricetes sp.]
MEKVEKSICQFLDNTIVSRLKASIYRLFTAFLPLFANQSRIAVLLCKG